MRRPPAAWLLAAVCASLGPGAGADGPAPEPPAAAPEAAARLRLLDERVRQWWNGRRRLIVKCPQCSGAGVVRWRRQWMSCPKCDGRKWHCPPEVYLDVHYELRSLAFRSAAGARERAEAAYKALLAGRPPLVLTRWRLHRVEPAGPGHATAWIVENDDTAPRPQRWVWAEEQPGKGAWSVWDESADGPWPAGTPAPASAGAATGNPLLPQEDADLAAALRGLTTLAHAPAGASKQGASLLLTLDLKRAEPGTDLRTLAVPDLRSIGRALWSASDSPWSEIRWTFRARYRDRFGALEQRPYLVGAIRREAFARIRWENLGELEALALFAPEQPEHDGWTLWRQE